MNTEYQNTEAKTTSVPALSAAARSGLSTHAIAIVSELKRCGGEVSSANLGLVLKHSNGMASNPGTLAATSVLRSLEKRGIVARRWVSGKGYGRTLWRLCPNIPNHQRAENVGGQK